MGPCWIPASIGPKSASLTGPCGSRWELPLPDSVLFVGLIPVHVLSPERSLVLGMPCRLRRFCRGHVRCPVRRLEQNPPIVALCRGYPRALGSSIRLVPAAKQLHLGLPEEPSLLSWTRGHSTIGVLGAGVGPPSLHGRCSHPYRPSLIVWLLPLIAPLGMKRRSLRFRSYCARH